MTAASANESTGSISDVLTRARRVALRPLLLIAAAGCTIWFNHMLVLQAVADWWIVSDTIESADAAVVLGGGIATRPFAASEYYRRGLTSKILVSNARVSRIEELGEPEMTRRTLVQLGIPTAAIEFYGSELSNTYQEAVALRKWALLTHARKVIVPTEIFSTRRVRWIMERELRGTGIQVEVPALDGPDYNRIRWWKNKNAWSAFQGEVIKYIYYRLRY